MDSLIKKEKIYDDETGRFGKGFVLAPKLSGFVWNLFFQMSVEKQKLSRKYHTLRSFSSAISRDIICQHPENSSDRL